MAQLQVQLKKRKSVIPWILLILGVIALIWFMFFPMSAQEGKAIPVETARPLTPAP